MILGIDIGTVNFAVCIIERNIDLESAKRWSLKFWRIYDTGIKQWDSKMTIGQKILTTISLIPAVYDSVAVESQPGKNKKMDYVEMAVLSHFLAKGIEVRSVHSKDKYSCLFGKNMPKGKKNYPVRKEMAVLYVRGILAEIELTYFESKDKKDDLADSLCIALCVL